MASNVTRDIHQVGHGFSVGNVLRFQNIYFLAQANNDSTAEVAGIVSAILGLDDFTLLTNGYINNLSGLTPNIIYFLSASSPGGLTDSEPTAMNHVSKPLLLSISTTEGYFNNFRGTLLLSLPEDDNARLFT